MSSYIVVIVTTANRDEAMKIVRSLLKERLIACANIVGPVSSIFWWEGKIEEAGEFLVFMKSHENHFERLSERIAEIHSYEVPEIIALPIIKGSQSYLKWLGDSLQSVNDHG
jgi:periplasmic divalent cation tolerance protein